MQIKANKAKQTSVSISSWSTLLPVSTSVNITIGMFINKRTNQITHRLNATNLQIKITVNLFVRKKTM